MAAPELAREAVKHGQTETYVGARLQVDQAPGAGLVSSQHAMSVELLQAEKPDLLHN